MPRFQHQSISPTQKSIARLVRTGKLDIYIRRCCGLGDVLMAALVVHALQKKLSSECFKVHLITHPSLQSLIIRTKLCNSVLTDAAVDVSELPFLVDLQGQVDFLPMCKNGHRLDLMADLVGLQPHEIQTDFKIKLDSEWRSWGLKQLDVLLTKRERDPAAKIIALAPWASTVVRSWPKWAEFFSLLLSEGYLVILLHSVLVPIADHSNLINLTGRTSTEQLFSVLQACDGAVVVDSGILHACGFLGIPFVGLFGSVNPEFRVKYYRNTEIICLEKACPFQFCYDWQRESCEDQPFYLKCMNEITPRIVFRKIETILKTC